MNPTRGQEPGLRIMRALKSAGRQDIGVPELPQSRGAPLEEGTARDLSTALGFDASQIRVHTSPAADQSARSAGASAFAHGTDIYFSQGAYAPDTPAGRSLLTHEATHVRQHLEGSLSSPAGDRGILSRPDEPAELEARKEAQRSAVRPEREASRRLPSTRPAHRMMREVLDYEGDLYYYNDVPVTNVELGQEYESTLSCMVILRRSTADWILEQPGFDQTFSATLSDILNPGGQAIREKYAFLSGPAVRYQIATDLRDSAERGSFDLVNLRSFIEGRRGVLDASRVVYDLEDWLRDNRELPVPIDWESMVGQLAERGPADVETAYQQSWQDRYDLFVGMIAAEIPSLEPEPSAVAVDAEELSQAILDYLGSEPDFGEATAWQSEAFLDLWMDQLVEVSYVPEGFDLYWHEPVLSESDIERERNRVIDEFLSDAPPAGVTYGQPTRAADLLVGFILDSWTRSRQDPESFLADLDLDQFRAEAIDYVVEEFIRVAASDESLMAALRDYGLESARWDLLVGMYMGALAMEGDNADLARRLRNDPITNLDDLERSVAADPCLYVTQQEAVGNASFDFFSNLDQGWTLEEATVQFVEDFWAAIGGEVENPRLALIVEFGMMAEQIRESFQDQLEAARERLREALDLSYDHIADIVRSYVEMAESFVTKKWIPAVKRVVRRRLRANRDKLQDWLDNWEDRTPGVIADYRLAAAVLNQFADDLDSGEVEHLSYEGHVFYARDVKMLRDAAKVMTGKADRLADPEGNEDRRDEIQEAVDGYNTVIDDLDNETYKPWSFGPDVYEEARRELGISGFEVGGMPLPVTYGQALSRRVVAEDNPFVMYAIARWEYIEKTEEEMTAVILLGGITLFTAITAILGLPVLFGLAMAGAADLMLLALDLGIGLAMGAKSVDDAYEMLRLARLDLDLSVQGVSEEDAEKALDNAWIGLIITGIFVLGLGILAAVSRFGSRSRMLSQLLLLRTGALRRSNPGLLTQLLGMTRNVRQLEAILGLTEDATLARNLLLHGSGDDVLRLLGRADNAEGLLGVLGHASIARTETLLDITSDTQGLMRVLDQVNDVSRTECLASGADLTSLANLLESNPLAIGLADDALQTLSQLDPDVVFHLSFGSADDLADVVRLTEQDASLMSRLLRTHADEALLHIQRAPFSSPARLESALARSASRVTEPVSGLYEAVEMPTVGGISTAPGGYSVNLVQSGERWISDVTAPSGAELSLDRLWDPSSGELTMNAAFSHSGTGRVSTTPPMLPATGRAQAGTPAMTYFSLQQMRAMGIPYGAPAAEGGLQTVKLSTIQNIETISHLHWLRQRYGVAVTDTARINDLIQHTHSYQYAESILTQAGYRITGAEVRGGTTQPIRWLTGHYEDPGTAQALFGRTQAEQVGVHTGTITRYGFDRDTEMFLNFNIYLTVEPL